MKSDISHKSFRNTKLNVTRSVTFLHGLVRPFAVTIRAVDKNRAMSHYSPEGNKGTKREFASLFSDDEIVVDIRLFLHLIKHHGTKTYGGMDAQLHAFSNPSLDGSERPLHPRKTASLPLLGPTQPPIQWILRAFSPGVKRQGREAVHSPPFSADVKYARRYTSASSHIFKAKCLTALRDNFTIISTMRATCPTQLIPLILSVTQENSDPAESSHLVLDWIGKHNNLHRNSAVP
jgi:hypothetical protein